MLTTLPANYEIQTATAQERRAAWSWRLWFACLLVVSVALGGLLLRRGPDLSLIAWLIYATGAAAILYRPRFGVYLTLAFALAGDNMLTYWYPFTKNFSSNESILFIHNAVIVSPAEVYIVLTYLSWLGRAAMRRTLNLHIGPIGWAALVFIGFITYGLVYGLLRGGDLSIALWEARAIYYLPLMLILAGNLLETRAHVNQLFWTLVVALFVEGLVGTWFVATILSFDISGVNRIAEHPASIHANTFFVLALGAWLFRASAPKRITLLLLLPIVALSYLANQRRAAFITLAIALLLLTALLYWENRRLFWVVTLAGGILGALYLAAFWNSGGALGLPARAIKTVIGGDLDEADYTSNLYRELENINIHFTISNAPLTGVGFGNKFLIIAPMADISFFIWWEYITHNAILWIWMKAGLGGFLALLLLIGLAVVGGLRAFRRMPGGDLSVIALTATLYVVMHTVFAYVDMAWDAQSMIYLGTMLGLLGGLERIVARPAPLPPRRWPWQPEPAPLPGLRPLR